MPPKAVDFRAEQLSYLTGRVHRLATDRDVDRWLSVCEKDSSRDPDSAEAVNVREWRREYELSARLPNQFVEDFEKQATLAKSEWAKARAKRIPIWRAHELQNANWGSQAPVCDRGADYQKEAKELDEYDGAWQDDEPPPQPCTSIKRCSTPWTAKVFGAPASRCTWARARFHPSKPKT